MNAVDDRNRIQAPGARGRQGFGYALPGRANLALLVLQRLLR